MGGEGQKKNMASQLEMAKQRFDESVSILSFSVKVAD